MRRPHDQGEWGHEEVREDLVVVEDREAEPEGCEQPVEREVTIAQAIRGPAEVRQLEARVVELGRDQGFATQEPGVDGHDHCDQDGGRLHASPVPPDVLGPVDHGDSQMA